MNYMPKHFRVFPVPLKPPLPSEELQEKVFGYTIGYVIPGSQEHYILEQAQALHRMGGLTDAFCEALRNAYYEDMKRKAKGE